MPILTSNVSSFIQNHGIGFMFQCVVYVIYGTERLDCYSGVRTTYLRRDCTATARTTLRK
jgi:hypothetical protein